MRWTRSRDGRQRVTVRTEHRLDAENLADILCCRMLSLGYELGGKNPSVAWLEDEIRAELASHGMGQWPYWRENQEDDEAEVMAWAVRQVARLGGRLRETGGTS
jgi:hypothetical protein